jgi:hypothetical protein
VTYFGVHLCKLTTCLCWPLFQERSVVNLDRFYCTIILASVSQHCAWVQQLSDGDLWHCCCTARALAGTPRGTTPSWRVTPTEKCNKYRREVHGPRRCHAYTVRWWWLWWCGSSYGSDSNWVILGEEDDDDDDDNDYDDVVQSGVETLDNMWMLA